MGLIRGILVVVVSVLLFFSFLLVNLSWTLSLSLSYENVQSQSTLIVKDILQEQIGLDDYTITTLPQMQLYCQNNSDYITVYQDYTFDIPCDIIMQGPDAVINETVKDFIHGIYYTEYDCDFLDCLKESEVPMFLVSEKAYDYWVNKFYFSLMASFILLILIFVLVEKKTNMPILAGSLMIVSSLPFLKLDSVLSLFADKMFVKFLSIFFSQAYPVATQTLIAGIILLALGIALKFFKVGFFISKFISKFKKNSETKKDNKKQEIKEKKEEISKGEKMKKKNKEA